MRLKAITTAFMVAVLFLLVASPTVLGPFPKKTAPREVKRTYGIRTLWYLGFLIIAFTGSGVGAYLVLKTAKDEYQRESLNNLKALLDAAEKDRQRSPNEPAKK